MANWLWQGCAVALAATALLRALPRASATTRYRVWWVALLFVLVLPLMPALLVAPQADARTMADAAPSSPTISLPPLPWWPAALMLGAWMLWTVGSLARIAGALVALRRAKAIATSFPQAREARLHGWLSVRRTGRHASLVVSEEVRSAGVLGLGEPAIAVSPVMLRELSNGELDQILVHEWAHVQRRDDIARLGQVIISAVAGLHPAVWWIDRQLHIERESACDDWTINVTGAPKGYAACLTKLAAMGNDGLLVPAAWSSSSLRTRVVRLLDRRRNRSTGFAVASMAVAPVLAAIAISAASVELVAFRPLALPSLNQVVRAVQATAEMVATQEAAAPATAIVMPAATMSHGRESAPPLSPTPRLGKIDAAAPQNSPSSVVSAPVMSGEIEPLLPTVPVVVMDPAILHGASVPVPTPETPSGAAAKNATPWGVASDAGVALGDAGVAVGDAGAATGVAVARGSKKSAVATAGFFSRLGKSIARSF